MSAHGFVTIFTAAHCSGNRINFSCGWNRRYDGDDPKEHTKVVAAARRHGGPGHRVHVERGSIQIYGEDIT